MREPLPVGAVLDAVRALATARRDWTVLVDGRSGAGKSTLAVLLAERTGAALVRLDDLYPGWDGLRAGAEQLRQDVLAPRACGRPGSWRRWDWAEDRLAERHLVPSTGGLICEGSGALTFASAHLAHLAVWVELDADERRRRALARDGALYAPHWERWAAQEDAAIERHDPQHLADLVVDGRRLPQVALSARTGGAHYPRRP